MAEQINIFLVEDHVIVRDGLRALLLGVEDIKIIDEADSGEVFFEKIKNIQPDIVILDIGLPGISGIEITQKLKLDYPEIKVIILTANIDKSSIIQAVKMGVAGFLSKDISKNEFIEAIRTVKNGEQYFGDTISKIIYKGYIEVIKGKQPKDKKALSIREIEIVKLISEGLTYKEIADKLFISPRTVETHRNNILEKLELNNNIALVKYAILHKLVDL